MSRIVYFYKITNLINGKIYIGQSINPERRWWDHKNLSLSPKPIQYISRAIKKYGKDNFTFEVIASSIIQDQKEIDIEEELIIQQYNSRFFSNGYNVRPGGSTRGSWQHSEETKRKMSENWSKHHSLETLARIHANNRGKPCSEQRRQRVSAANKGRQFCLGHKQSKEVIQKRLDSLSALYGSRVCNAPGCQRTDGCKVNGVRYCDLHEQRVRRTGSLELKKRQAPNKGKPLSEETKKKLSKALKGKRAHNKGVPMDPAHKEKLRQLSIGREPVNKIKLTAEDLDFVLTTKSWKEISEKLKISKRVISRIKKSLNSINLSI
jgi:group I intron endonuclease